MVTRRRRPRNSQPVIPPSNINFVIGKDRINLSWTAPDARHERPRLILINDYGAAKRGEDFTGQCIYMVGAHGAYFECSTEAERAQIISVVGKSEIFGTLVRIEIKD